MDSQSGNPVEDLLQKMGGLFKPKRFLVMGAIVLGITGVKSSIYTVPTDAEAVVLRFGRYVKTEQPGLRFKAPFGIDRKEIVPVRRQLKLEFGFATGGATDEYQAAPYEIQEFERSMITGDSNAATVEWVVQYRIESPRDFLFKVRNPKGTLRDCSESVMREVVGDRTVDEVITIGRQEIEDVSVAKLQALVNSYALGIKVDQIQLKNVNPPGPVKRSFDEVNQAQQEKERSINVARGQANKIVPRTKGEADRRVAAAEGTKTQRVNEALGDAQRFTALYQEYSKAPAVTRQRLYLESMQEVLPTLQRKVIVDEDASGVLPLLHLGEDGTKLKTVK
jgi:membrane protease subunit HflK